MKYFSFRTAGCGTWQFGLLIAIMMLLKPTPLHPQTVYGSIYGTALDSSGAVVVNAAVLVTSQQKGLSYSGKTNTSGEYRIDHLVADTYDVTISAAGFKSFTLKGVQINAGDSPRVDATMQIGSAAESITVAATAEALLKTETQDVSLTITKDTVTNIPLQSRAANNLILLNPGASTYFGQWGIIPEVAVGGAWYNVDGQPQGSQDFTLDGTDNTDLMLGTIVINPAPESISAVKIITNNYSADTGKSNSAVLPMETKSGSNTFHGLISDFRTSGAFLARNPFSAVQSAPNKLPASLNNQPEANIGGPILKNRMFFFFDYYANRGRLGGSTLTTVPTAHLHNTCLGTESTSTGVLGCDFGEYMLPTSQGGLGSAGIIYQSDGTPYPGNIIPANQLSQPALNFLKLIPLPQGGSSLVTSNFGASGNGVANTGQYTARIDDQISSTAHVFGRYTYFHDQVQGASAFGNLGAGGPNIVGVGGISRGHNQSWALGLDDAVRTSLLTDVRLGYYRYRVQSVKFDQDKTPATDLGMPNLNNPRFALTGGSPAYLVTGGAAMSFGTGLAVNTCNCPLQQLEEQFQIVNNWTKIVGSHTIKVGADLRYGRQFRADSGVNRTGNLTFGAGPTSANGFGGLGIATMMLGEVSGFSRDVSAAGNNAKEFQRRTFYYGMDTWRVTHNLTINYGLRWEIVFPERVNGAGKGSHLDLSTGNLLVAGIGGVSLNMNYSTTWGNLAPRVGFSYQLGKSSVIRAGYGRSFAMGTFGTVFAVDQTESLPVFVAQTLTAPSITASVFNLSTGPQDYVFPTIPSNGILPFPDGATITTRPNPLRLSTVDQWNVSFQRAITSTMTVSAAYAGNKGTHVWAGIFSTINANPNFTILPASASVTGTSLYYDPNVSASTVSLQHPSYPVGIDDNGHTSVTKYLLPYYAKYGWTQGINYNCNCSDNHFHALQITLSKHVSNGLSLNANYAWQMTRDYDSGYFAVDKKIVYGPENFSKNQVFNLYGFYQLPFGRNGQFFKNVPRWADYIVGGYQISPVVSIQGGLPFTPTYANCSRNVVAGAPCFPNQNGSFKTSLTAYNPSTHSRSYFAPSPTLLSASNPNYGPFSYPSLDQVGNTPRNSFRGPGQWNADVALSKTISIRESLQGQFRVDAFNAFNHINPGNPIAGIDSPIGGRILSMATNLSPRQLVFAAKIFF